MIIANIIIVGSVVFLIGKAVWQDSESFKLWKWKKIIALKNWNERTEYRRNYRIKQLREKIPSLKTIYIIVAGAIGLLLLYVFRLVYAEIININWAEAASGDSGIRNLAIAFLGTTSGIGALFGVYLAILKSETNERQTQTAEQGMITDRINKATDGLGKNNDKGNPVVEVRLGALYALERIAQDSIRDHVQIMEILCAYVRHNSLFHNEVDDKIKLREDIHAAIKIIGRRKKWSDGEKRVETEETQNYYIDLRYCDLHGADLSKSYLASADISGANLNGANLNGANLNRADFARAKLNFADLGRAELNFAYFNNAELKSANLYSAIIRGANFNIADLTRANLGCVNMSNTHFRATNFDNAKTYRAYAYGGELSHCKNLTNVQIAQMFCGVGMRVANANSSEKLKRPRHWPKEKLSYEGFIQEYDKWLKITPTEPT
ncbi:MAG: pentapeptide repeat-containing protein [Proteobacteria bacterium]|nr:pentapeptide repeat-containing protein [Pseudomonadota bacterium]